MRQEKTPKLYGCMSKVEFKKWKNKWELYKIFHPGQRKREGLIVSQIVVK